MRTQEEIVKRIEKIGQRDPFDAERADLIHHLDFDHAKAFLNEDRT